MSDKTITGVVTWLRNWFYTKSEVDSLITTGGTSISIEDTDLFDVLDCVNTNFGNLNSSTTTNVTSLSTSIPNIECSDYNPSIDNNITVTITVTDVYGNAISDKSVTVTASEGNFTQLDGNNITNASSVTGTTDSSGQFTLTYACSEWGLITFSTNNSNIQIKVTGVKTIIITSNITLYVNGDSRTCTMRINGLSGSVSKADTPNVVYTIPSTYAQYLPKTTLLQQDYNRNRIDLLGSNGEISMMQSAVGSGNLNVTFTYNY